MDGKAEHVVHMLALNFTIKILNTNHERDIIYI